MVKEVLKIVVLLVLMPKALAAGITPDSITIRNFSAQHFKASNANYHGIELENEVVMFANENGVLLYDGSEWKTITIDNFSPAISLLKHQNRIYVGGRNEFGYLEARAKGVYEYTSLRHLLQTKDNSPLSEVWQIVAMDNDIYFESYEMILRYDGKKIHTIPAQFSYIFKAGNKLFASIQNKGLARIEGDSLTIVNAGFRFPYDMAFSHLRGLENESLLLTPDHGIFTFDTSTYTTRQWEGAANAVLAKNSLYSMLKWNDSIYICSTYLGGVFLLNKKGEIIRSFDKNSGLQSHFQREIFKDSRDNIWITSDFGLSYLQFPGSENLSVKPEPEIRYLTVNEQRVNLGWEETALKTENDYQGAISFHFASPGFHKEELEYSYKLEGYEKKWSDWSTITSREYNNLNPGQYTFLLKSRHEGIISEPVSFGLNLPVSWYKTKAFYLCGLLLLGLGIYFIFQYRTKKLKQLNSRLAKIIKNRTAELVAQKEQLAISNQNLHVKNNELDNFVYRSSHDLVAPLKSLKGLITIAQMEGEKENLPTYFNLMNTSIDKLESFIKSIMEYSSNAKKGIEVEKVDLDEMLDSIIEDIKFYDKIEKIEFVRNFTIPYLYTDPRRLRIVLSNLVTNSIKYHNYQQEKLFVEVRSELEEGQIKIEVVDNGNGISTEYIDKIFDMFFRASNSAQGSGLGLYIVKDTVEKLGGKISVRSQTGKGTVFTLLFPNTTPIFKHAQKATSLEENV